MDAKNNLTDCGIRAVLSHARHHRRNNMLFEIYAIIFGGKSMKLSISNFFGLVIVVLCVGAPFCSVVRSCVKAAKEAKGKLDGKDLREATENRGP